MSKLSLREYVDMRFGAIEKTIAAAMVANRDRIVATDKAIDAMVTSIKDSVTKKEMSDDRRFESVNEFRRTLADISRLMMPRVESERMHGATNEKIEGLVRRLNAQDDQGKGSHQSWVALGSIVSVIMSVIMAAILLLRSH